MILTTPRKRMTTAMVMQDVHYPFHDPVAVALAEMFMVDIQPDYLIYPGDIGDFYPISSFSKDPNRATGLQSEVDQVDHMLERHGKLCPDAEKILLPGNHEDRLRRFLWKISPGLNSLACLSLAELYQAKKNNVTILDYEEGVMINGVFLIVHGDRISKHSGMTAKAMADKHGGSGMCGHSHRGGSFLYTDRFDPQYYGWYENFCLCDLDPEYTKHPNWMQGFSLVHFKDDRFWVEQIPVVGHKFMYGGKVYEN